MFCKHVLAKTQTRQTYVIYNVYMPIESLDKDPYVSLQTELPNCSISNTDREDPRRAKVLTKSQNLDYMTLGRLGGKYSHGVWERLADIC